MVIFGKKAKALIKRVDKLETYVTQIKNAQDELLKTLSKIRGDVYERIASGETALKELTLTVENGFENGEVKKTPQQLMNEWFTGVEEK